MVYRSWCVVKKIDKIILDVIASFQMENIQVPLEVVCDSKDMLILRENNKVKKLTKKVNYSDNRGIKY